MAITRAQIARQLLAEGGVSLDDAKMMAPPGEFLAYINPKEADMLRAAGGSGIMTAMGIPSFVDFGRAGSESYAASFGGPSPDRGPTSQEDSGFDTGDVNVGLRGGMPAFTPPPGSDGDGGGTLKIPSIITSGLKSIGGGLRAADKFARNIFKTDRKNLALRTEFLRDKGVIGPGEEDEKYSDEFLLSDAGLDMLRGMGYRTIDDMTKGSDDSTPTLFRQKLVPVPETTEPEKTGIEKVLADADEFRFLLPERFKLEEGGIVPRQGYFVKVELL